MTAACVAILAAFASSEAFAQQEQRGAFPSVEDLKSKVGFDEEQAKKAEPVCTEYSAKLKEAMAKAKDAADKKAAYGEIRTLKAEGMGKLKEICKDDEQKKKLDEAFPARRKKE
jgi:hypothetical protein